MFFSICWWHCFGFFSVDVAAFLSTVPTASVVVVRTHPGNSRFLPAFFVFILFSVRFI